MAEVKTYKCDICGEVYHEDYEYTDTIEIIHKIKDRDEANVTFYRDVCPHCQGMILEIIRNPDAIEKMGARMDELSVDASSRWRALALGLLTGMLIALILKLIF